jgi:hypothetical protein
MGKDKAGRKTVREFRLKDLCEMPIKALRDGNP